MIPYLDISANFRIGKKLPSIDQQYHDLWKLASILTNAGLPIDVWSPPADTPEHSRLNHSFDAKGPTAAAIAIAKADKSNLAPNMRILGAWNGQEGTGGMAFTTKYTIGFIPSLLDLSEESIPAFDDHKIVSDLVAFIVHLWKPMMVKVTPWDYEDVAVFPDRPPVGWMLYLPFDIKQKLLPEAELLIPIHANNTVQGTIIVSTLETFDMDNPEHIRRANAIETRLVDQDLLPTLSEFRDHF